MGIPNGYIPRCSTNATPLHWRNNYHDSVSNHQTHACLLNRLFRRRSKKTSKLCVAGHCAGNSPGPVNSPHKWPVTRKMFPFDDVIMQLWTTHHITEPCDFRLSLHYPTPLSVSLQKPMQLLSMQILQILSQCLQNFTFTMCFRTVAYVFLLHRVDFILRPFQSVWTLVF